MGACKPGYTSIHSLLQGDFNKCTVNHTSEHENQFWVLTFPLQPGYERKADELEIGRIKNVRKTIRFTREMSSHPISPDLFLTGVGRGGYQPVKTPGQPSPVSMTPSVSLRCSKPIPHAPQNISNICVSSPSSHTK